MDTRIEELFQQASRPLLSYEFFPPKSDAGRSALDNAIDHLQGTNPDFVTVTYGAGGSTRGLTFDICQQLRDRGFAPVMPHLTCVGSSRDQLNEIADEIHDRGFRNIMTLRGDPPKGETRFQAAEDGLSNARDLVGLLRNRHADFCCGVAGYPEIHPEAESPEIELAYLKEKVDAGASFVTTQLFFDNRHYFDFVARCQSAGITVPVLPGLLPASSIKQVARFTDLCGSSFPAELGAALEAAGGEGPDAEEAGIRWCAKQIEGLLEGGVPGIHLYILNKAHAPLHPELGGLLESLTRG